MRICSNEHEEIVWESYEDCPLCNYQCRNCEDLEDKIDTLNLEIDALKDDLDELEEKYETVIDKCGNCLDETE